MNVNGAAQIIWSFNNLMIMFEFIMKSLNFDLQILYLLKSCILCIVITSETFYEISRFFSNICESGSSIFSNLRAEIDILKRYYLCFLTDRRAAMKGGSKQKESHSASFLLSIFLH